MSPAPRTAPVADLPFDRAILAYRDEWLIERSFHRLKGTPLSIAPLFVKRDHQIIGPTHLLTLAVRFLTLIEFQVRRELSRRGGEGTYRTVSRKSKENHRLPDRRTTLARVRQHYPDLHSLAGSGRPLPRSIEPGSNSNH